MAIEDVFNGARTGLTLLDAYVNVVAREIGMERALALQARMCEEIGALQAKMMREQSGLQQFDARTAWSLMESIPQSLGLKVEFIEESPEKTVAKIGRCSVYEAALALGLEAKTIESMCRAGPEKMMGAVAKQLNPDLRYQVTKFRSSAQDFCEEEVAIH